MRQPFHWPHAPALLVLICVGFLSCTIAARGDQVETVTGDRYVGRVLSFGNDTLVLQSEVLGTLKLPRSRIATISLGAPATSLLQATNAVRLGADSSSRTNVAVRVASHAASTNVSRQFDSAMRQLSANSNVISQVQGQFLSGAGPEAQGKFNELVAGLLSGNLGVNELRTQAKTTLDQARAAQKELGDEGGSSLESYLSILEGFLKETAPAVDPTNSPTVPSSHKITAQKSSLDE